MPWVSKDGIPRLLASYLCRMDSKVHLLSATPTDLLRIWTLVLTNNRCTHHCLYSSWTQHITFSFHCIPIKLKMVQTRAFLKNEHITKFHINELCSCFSFIAFFSSLRWNLLKWDRLVPRSFGVRFNTNKGYKWSLTTTFANVTATKMEQKLISESLIRVHLY